MAAAVQLGFAAGSRMDGHHCVSTYDVGCNAWDELLPAHFHTLLQAQSPSCWVSFWCIRLPVSIWWCNRIYQPKSVHTHGRCDRRVLYTRNGGRHGSGICLEAMYVNAKKDSLIWIIRLELLSKYSMYSFYQSRYGDAIGYISIKTVHSQGRSDRRVLHSRNGGLQASGSCLEAMYVRQKGIILFWIIRHVCRMQFM